ncbi:hypothetical protein E2P81_ATG10688 [Venturia nashicola]|uniref:Uncharacterized protein n=1 Tax=Venturia nashicola TaxID=86259 RepID=A0A4Z1NW36_9PEZI|nr:hypothetical protein E6O75_ATG10357 [Venturia nashicola]TLD27400.1 hypothetical protein E2P81_ATG10688 [Venturia nashicola]
MHFSTLLTTTLLVLGVSAQTFLGGCGKPQNDCNKDCAVPCVKSNNKWCCDIQKTGPFSAGLNSKGKDSKGKDSKGN